METSERTRMFSLRRFFHLLLVLTAFLSLAAGCKRAPTLERAMKSEAEGQYANAALQYEAYLTGHPGSAMGALVCYRAARAHDQAGDLERAIEWYRAVGEKYPGSIEEVESLLELGALYLERLKDEAQGLACYEKALQLYMGRSNIRQAIQSLTEAQYLTATAHFTRRDFRKADLAASSILKNYPSGFLPTDTRIKVEALVDRVERADAIARADATLIVIREQIPYQKGFEADFPAAFTVDAGSVPSPDGKRIAKCRTVQNVTRLYLGKVAKDGKTVNYLLVPGTGGVSFPTWSPLGSELVYRRVSGAQQSLEKVEASSRRTHVLFTTPSKMLGKTPLFHPSGNKIAFVYQGNFWLINSNGTNKSMLKTKNPISSAARIQWSNDGTMLRYQQKGAKGEVVDGILVLDVSDLGT